MENKEHSHEDDPSSETDNSKDHSHCMTQEDSQKQEEDSQEYKSGSSQNKLPGDPKMDIS